MSGAAVPCKQLCAAVSHVQSVGCSVRLPADTRLHSYGLYSYGLYSRGLYSYGKYSYALYSYGLYILYEYRVQCSVTSSQMDASVSQVQSLVQQSIWWSGRMQQRSHAVSTEQVSGAAVFRVQSVVCGSQGQRSGVSTWVPTVSQMFASEQQSRKVRAAGCSCWVQQQSGAAAVGCSSAQLQQGLTAAVE